MKKNVKLLVATTLMLSLLPTTIFGAQLNVSTKVLKQDTDVPFNVILSAGTADIVQEGTVSLSLEEGTFVTKDVKAFLGTKQLSTEVNAYEKSVLLTFDAAAAAKIKGGEEIKVSGIIDVDGLGEKKLTVDAGSIGLGVHTETYATMTEEDISFLKVLSKIPSVGYQKESKLADILIVPKAGERISLILPYGIEWNAAEMKKSENLGNGKFVSLKGNMLVLELKSGTSSVMVKPIVNISEDAAKGDLEIEVKTKSNSGKAVVANIADYKVTLETIKGVKKEFENKKDIPVTVELKSSGGRLPQTSYVDFKVIGGEVTGEVINAKEVGAKAKIQDTKGRAVDKFAFRTNDKGETMKLNLLVTPNKGVKMVSLEASLRNAEAKTDLVEVIAPVTVKVNKINIQGGVLDEAVGDIVIEETVTRALSSGEVYGIKVKNDKFGQILFGQDAKINAKDVLVKEFGLSKEGTALQFMLNRASSGSDKGIIELSDIKVSTQRTIANGEYKAILFKAVNPAKELENIVLADGKEYGMEEIAEFPFFSIGKEKTISSTEKKQTIFTLNSLDYTVDGIQKQLATAVYTKDGYTMLPMRVVAETLEVDVAWDNTTKVATFTKGDVVVKVKSNGSSLEKNGMEIKMNTASENIKGSLFLPLSSLGDAFGLERGTGYEWVPATRQVIVRY